MPANITGNCVTICFSSACRRGRYTNGLLIPIIFAAATAAAQIIIYIMARAREVKNL